MISAKIIADTKHKDNRLTTFELVYPRYIHAELMTHRVFSRNAASSRAIPIDKMMELVQEDTVVPIWTENQSGMQGKVITNLEKINKLNNAWFFAARQAINNAKQLQELGAHKQNVNRILEPYQHIKVIVTATNYDNWFNLRYHPDAQGEIVELAKAMAAELYLNTPDVATKDTWHLPYVDTDTFLECINTATKYNKIAKETVVSGMDVAKAVSASCCAQVSYRKLDTSIEKALSIFNSLVGGVPLHASPFEHQALPCKVGTEKGNFTGWKQFRRDIENGDTIHSNMVQTMQRLKGMDEEQDWY